MSFSFLYSFPLITVFNWALTKIECHMPIFKFGPICQRVPQQLTNKYLHNVHFPKETCPMDCYPWDIIPTNISLNWYFPEKGISPKDISCINYCQIFNLNSFLFYISLATIFINQILSKKNTLLNKKRWY